METGVAAQRGMETAIVQSCCRLEPGQLVKSMLLMICFHLPAWIPDCLTDTLPPAAPDNLDVGGHLAASEESRAGDSWIQESLLWRGVERLVDSQCQAQSSTLPSSSLASPHCRRGRCFPQLCCAVPLVKQDGSCSGVRALPVWAQQMMRAVPGMLACASAKSSH